MVYNPATDQCLLTSSCCPRNNLVCPPSTTTRPTTSTTITVTSTPVTTRRTTSTTITATPCQVTTGPTTPATSIVTSTPVTTRRTTSTTITGNACIGSCIGKPDGNYPACQPECKLGIFYSCVNGYRYTRNCALGWYIDSNNNRYTEKMVSNPATDQCLLTSTCCPRNLS
ncbi:hypothetical protein Btru_070598 [Bulinus truncatus]|nr:hypothetical protein Btru_070598 [Bulinus truncatus]